MVYTCQPHMLGVFPATPQGHEVASSTHVLKHLWFILFNHPFLSQVRVKISKLVCIASWHYFSFQHLGKDVSLFYSVAESPFGNAPKESKSISSLIVRISSSRFIAREHLLQAEISS